MTDLEKLQLRVERAKRKANNALEWIKAEREVAPHFANVQASVALNIAEGYVCGILNALENNDD